MKKKKKKLHQLSTNLGKYKTRTKQNQDPIVLNNILYVIKNTKNLNRQHDFVVKTLIIKKYEERLNHHTYIRLYQPHSLIKRLQLLQNSN